MHSRLFSAIIRGRMRFFDTTPTGSLVNRFSADMNVVDQTLPTALNSFLFTSGEVLAVFIVISVSFPIFAVIIFPVGALYYFLMRVYIPSSRQVKRFETSAKSPINLHFSETVRGADIIRAFGEQSRFAAESSSLVAQNLRFLYILYNFSILTYISIKI